MFKWSYQNEFLVRTAFSRNVFPNLTETINLGEPFCLSLFPNAVNKKILESKCQRSLLSENCYCGYLQAAVKFYCYFWGSLPWKLCGSLTRRSLGTAVPLMWLTQCTARPVNAYKTSKSKQRLINCGVTDSFSAHVQICADRKVAINCHRQRMRTLNIHGVARRKYGLCLTSVECEGCHWVIPCTIVGATKGSIFYVSFNRDKAYSSYICLSCVDGVIQGIACWDKNSLLIIVTGTRQTARPIVQTVIPSLEKARTSEVSANN